MTTFQIVMLNVYAHFRCKCSIKTVIYIIFFIMSIQLTYSALAMEKVDRKVTGTMYIQQHCLYKSKRK